LQLLLDPPSLQNLSFSPETCGISNYSVRIQWEAPSEYGGGINNYTITVTVPELTAEVFQTNQHYIIPSLLYNYVYEVSIAAENCNGISEDVSIFISKGEAVSFCVHVIQSLCEQVCIQQFFGRRGEGYNTSCLVAMPPVYI